MKNAMGVMDRYERQLLALQDHFEHPFDVYICEGKSGDGTKSYLKQSPLKPAVINDDNEGVHSFSHLEDTARWQTLTNAWNKATHAVINGTPDAPYDYVLLIECELIWTPTTLLTCLDMLQNTLSGIDVIAPGLWCHWDHNRYYDTNGFRTPDGQKWRNEYPYYPGYTPQRRLVDCSTVGGLIVMRADLLPHVEWRDTCRLFYPEETSVVADMSQKVFHP